MIISLNTEGYNHRKQNFKLQVCLLIKTQIDRRAVVSLPYLQNGGRNRDDIDESSLKVPLLETNDTPYFWNYLSTYSTRLTTT